MPKVKIVTKITDKGWPVHNKKYKSAHQKANEAEKKDDPKAYKRVNKLERSLGKHELMAKHTKGGVVEIEEKFAKDKKIRKNLIKHEVKEHKIEIKK